MTKRHSSLELGAAKRGETQEPALGFQWGQAARRDTDCGIESCRLSDNAAPGAAESETVFRSCGSDDDPPGCWGNADAGNQSGNPDVRVPERTTKEDGFCAHGAKEGKDTNSEDQEGEDAEHESGSGNIVVSLKIDDQPWENTRAATLDLRHIPGGTWLTKVRSFIKIFSKKGECDGRRRE
ncbi:hypothetical protein NDU88_004604 [Pleurodeles waltl]|uniref:Uncharacterized protein n=1 Tax=Pleurodeles waltl TaxID=8319 RepID=A0AAV7RK29_PLEWA|nr:hypothetical protein NDU88_004604 [Pleurodeles waltl]